MRSVSSAVCQSAERRLRGIFTSISRRAQAWRKTVTSKALSALRNSPSTRKPAASNRSQSSAKTVVKSNVSWCVATIELDTREVEQATMQAQQIEPQGFPGTLLAPVVEVVVHALPREGLPTKQSHYWQPAPLTTGFELVENRAHDLGRGDARTATGGRKGQMRQQPGLPGVTVLLKGTATGVSTSTDGRYSLNVPESGGILVISSVGMTTQEVEIGSRTTLDLVLSANNKELNEVVVTGYGQQQERREITGSVVTVTSAQYKDQPII
nr:hypothetical protein [Tanacetum cinerariifolium]